MSRKKSRPARAAAGDRNPPKRPFFFRSEIYFDIFLKKGKFGAGVIHRFKKKLISSAKMVLPLKTSKSYSKNKPLTINGAHHRKKGRYAGAV